MSKRALQLLRSLGLVDRKHHPLDMDAVSDETLLGILDQYFQGRAETATSEATALAADSVPLSTLVSSVSGRGDVDSLLPTLLVFGRVCVRDPLFELAKPESSSTRASRQALGGPAFKPVDRGRLKAGLEFFSALSGFMREEIAVALPLGLAHIRGDRVPIFYSEDNFKSALPVGIYRFVHENAEIRDIVVDRRSGRISVPKGLKESPSRAISVSFRDDPTNLGMFFFFTDVNWESTGTRPGEFRVSYRYDLDKPIESDVYEAWKEQSINRTAINRLESVGDEIALAEFLGATYLTESPFESRLLALAGHCAEDTRAADAVNLMRANSPTLTIGNPRQLLRVRRKSRKVFARLQTVLLDAATEVQGTSGIAFEQKAQAVLRRLVEPEVRRAEHRLGRLIAVGAGSVVSISASVGLAVLSGSALPLGAVIGLAAVGTAASSLPSISQYLRSRRHPEHILWALHRRSAQ